MSDPDIAASAASKPELEPGLDPSLDSGLAVSPSEIPDKLYFRIGEVARLAGIKPYVLRFWETEFPSLGPRKSGTGHRLYRRKDVEQVLEIKQLLYEKRYTIEGARKFMGDRAKAHSAAAASGSKSKGRGKAARATATAVSSATPALAAGQYQAGLFDSPSPAVLDLVRKELKAIAEMLK